MIDRRCQYCEEHVDHLHNGEACRERRRRIEAERELEDLKSYTVKLATELYYYDDKLRPAEIEGLCRRGLGYLKPEKEKP